MPDAPHGSPTREQQLFGPEYGPSHWSPPQFSLRTIMIAVVVVAAFSFVLRLRGADTFFSTLAIFVAACVLV